MLSPFDWQEAVGHRAKYIQSRIEPAVPVLAASLSDGLLAVTMRRQSHKLFEVYDRLILGAIGQQSDIEALRVAAIEFAHREGFQRSEQDVTIQRVVHAMSAPIKAAFANFQAPPFVAKAMLLEICQMPDNDNYYVIDFDGDFFRGSHWMVLAGSTETRNKLEDAARSIAWAKLKTDKALETAQELLTTAAATDDGSDEDDGPLILDAALMLRGSKSVRRFKLLGPE